MTESNSGAPSTYPPIDEMPDVDRAFDPEARKAQEELDTYMANRPYKDDQGNVHDPTGGDIVTGDEYHDQQREIHFEESQKPYEDMGMLELARELAQAEVNEDSTSIRNISDVLMEKLIEQAGDMQAAELWNAHKGGKDSPAVNRPDAAPMESDPETALIDRVLDYKDAQKSKIVEERVHESTRAEIDPDRAYDIAVLLNLFGVPDDIIKNLPKEYFYSPDNPAYRDITIDQPPEYKEWVTKNHPEWLEGALPDAAQEAVDFFESQEGQDLNQELGIALNEYAEQLTKQDTRHFSTRKGREVTEIARQKYEKKRFEIQRKLIDYLISKGFNEEAISREIQRQFSTPSKPNSNQEYGGDVGLVEHVTRAEAERFSREHKITKWLSKIWAKDGYKGVLGRLGIMTPVGLAAGAVTGAALSPVLGPVGGVAAAVWFSTRITKSLLGVSMSTRSRVKTKARENAAMRRRLQLESGKKSQYSDDVFKPLDATSEFTAGVEENIKKNRKRAIRSGAVGLVAGGVGAALVDGIGDIDINPFDGDGDSAPVPPVGEGDGDHFERTRFGELFKLDGDPNDPSRLQLVHEDQLDKASDLVTLRTADGTIIAEHMRIGPFGLRPEDLARIHEAGYEVNFTPDADSGAGRIEIFKTDLQEQE